MNHTTLETSSLVDQIASVYFWLDEECAILQPSTTLSKYLPNISQKNLNDVFDVQRPTAHASFENLKSSCGAMALLVDVNRTFAIRGQFVFQQNNSSLLFVGAPWLSWITSEAESTKISISDFRANDPQLDQMILLSTEKQNLQDLQELTDELRAARDRAEAGVKVQADFIAIMSHEMRTPLNGVITSLGLIPPDAVGGDTQEMLDIAQKSSANLRDVINHVLNYSKLQAGGFRNEPNSFDLREMIESAASILSARAREQRSQIWTEFDENLYDSVLADEPKLRQVLINLLSNAVKHCKNGDITVKVRLMPDGKDLSVSVTDTGSGIPLDLQSKVFQPFWTRQENTLEQRGTGLGLNICKRLVNLLGGSIDFTSEPGVGTTFFFTIPVEKGDPLPDIESSSPVDHPGFVGSVLLVEDNQTNQYLARLLLEKRGLKVTTADNGQAALDLIEHTDFDLVLMDISMPVMGGVTATEILRASYSPIELPIVAMTAHAEEEDHQRYLKAGMNAVLLKPIDLKLLDKNLAIHLPSVERPKQRTDELEMALSEKAMDRTEADKLRGEVGVEVFAQVAMMFEEEASARLVEIEAAWKQKDLLILANKSHSIRASAASVGCSALAKLLKAIEIKSRNEDVSELDSMVESLPSLLNSSMIKLREYSQSK